MSQSSIASTPGQSGGGRVRRSWAEIGKEVIERTDVIAVAKSWGVEFTGYVDEDGWHKCSAVTRTEDNPSAYVNEHTGFYHDFGGDGESFGFFELGVKAKNGGFADWRATRAYLAEQAGVDLPNGKAAKGRAGASSGKTRSTEKPATPYSTADEAIEAFRRSMNATLAGVWNYDTADLEYRIARYDLPGGRKEFRPLHRRPDGKWIGKSPSGLRPLYRRDSLVASTGPIYVLEGEKVADMAVGLGLEATTAPHGALSPDKADWSPIADKLVIILPDHDDAGKRYAGTVRDSLFAANPAARVKIVDLPLTDQGDDLEQFIGSHPEPRDLRAIGREIEEMAEAVPFELQPVAVQPMAAIDGDQAAKVRIVVDSDMRRVIDAAEASLRAEQKVFVRNNMLVRVVASQDITDKHQPERPGGTPVIFPVEDATLAEMMSHCGAWVKRVPLPDGQEGLKAVIPPTWAVKGLQARKAWPSLRPLAGIVETPTIRADGTILDTPGWDSQTKLLYAPSIDFPRIPDSPTREDAKIAAETLLDIVCDVPFKDRRHAAAWLAALLTVIARHAVAGAVPMFVFSANIRAVGKSLLCDLINAIAAGRDMPRMAMPTSEEEFRKVAVTISIEGDRVTMFDNIATGTPIGGETLDNVLTATVFTGRILGTNGKSTLSWETVLFATGNNLTVKADTFSRTVWSLIESDEVNPEARKDFKVKGCLVRHVKERRAELVAAALTILRAHAVAGRPGNDELPAIRSNYASWSEIIRSAVHFATGCDPCEVQDDERSIDQDAETVDTLVSGWKAVCDEAGKRAMRAAEVLEVLRNSPEKHEGLRELFLGWSRDKDLPSSRSVGRYLAKFKKRPSKFGSLDETPKVAGFAAWYVREPKTPPAKPSDGAFEAFSAFASQPPTREPGKNLPHGVTAGEKYGEGQANAPNALNTPAPPPVPDLPPIDPAKIDAAYQRWNQAERKQFADRVDALEADGLDIGKARDQAFRELTGPTS